jgi:hypothetical protein
VKLLSNNRTVAEFVVHGYMSNFSSMLFGGLVTNSGVRTLKLENIDMDRDSLPTLVKAFGTNRSITTLYIARGLNTISGMTIFHSLRPNTSITELYISEGTCNEGGYQLLG